MVALPIELRAHARSASATATLSQARGPARSRVETAARALAIVACLWFPLALSWGMFARVAAGHEAVVASRAIVADNMLVWHILAPVRDYTAARPGPEQYYAHHPWGSFWAITAFVAALGRHAFVPRLVAVLTSAAAPPLLYAIGGALWGPIPGALAALAYVTLPITLAFGNFPGFEGPVVTSCLLVTWAAVRFVQTGKRRWLAASLIGVFWAVNADWESNVFLAGVVAIVVGGAFFRRSPWMARVDLRRFMQWAALATVVALGVVAGYFLYFQSIGAIGNLLAQEVKRSRGNGVPLFEVLSERRYWIDVTFTPLAVLVGKIALPVLLVRVLVLRRVLEAFALALLTMAIFQYLMFKNGADVHIYWPYPFAPYYALSVGVLAETARAGFGALASLFGAAWSSQRVLATTFAAVGAIPVLVLPDGLAGLRYDRTSGGRFNERGKLTFREEDKAQALEWMAQRMPGRSTVQIHEGMHPTWAQTWALARPGEAVNPVPAGHASDELRYFIGDLRFLNSSEQLRLAQSYPVVAVGPFVLADRSQSSQPAVGYVFDQREPNFLEWYLHSGVDPIRTIRADAFYTWELRENLGQSPNPPPSSPPTTAEELRIAHNMAVAAGNVELAQRYEKELLSRADAGLATTYDDGTKLLAGAYAPGVAPSLTLYFLAPGPALADYTFEVVSVIERRALFSLVPADDKAKRVGAPFSVPPRLWKKGFIYAVSDEIRHRPGHERFIGYFSTPSSDTPPQPVAGPATIGLLTLD